VTGVAAALATLLLHAANVTDSSGASPSQVPTGPPVSINSIEVLPSGIVRLRIACGAANSVFVHGSSDLQRWIPLSTLSATNGLAEFIDTEANRYQSRIYRVQPNFGTVVTLATMNDLRNLVPSSSPSAALLQGYYTPSDGGGGSFYWAASATETDDGGMVITPTSTPPQGRWKRITNGQVQVKWFGVAGDGVTDDGARLLAAITAAGTGGTVLFNANSTYLSSAELRPQVGQTWTGYGATIKRAPQRYTTTATPVPTGQAAVQVVLQDPSQLKVGDWVTLVNGSVFDPDRHFVSAINGANVTLTQPFTVAFPNGGTVLTSHMTIVGNQDSLGAKILGLTIDGNQSQNQLLQRWEVNVEIALQADGGLIRDCSIHDAQSEGIVLGGVNSSVENCWIWNCQGNGIHLSGWQNASLVNNVVTNCNLAGQATGHAAGCIAFSIGAGKATITGNYLANGLAGVGEMIDPSTKGTIIQNNTIRNCPNGAINMATPDASLGQILFTDNLIYQCGLTLVENTDSQLPILIGPKSITIDGNYWEDSALFVGTSSGVSISDNQFITTANPSTSTPLMIFNSSSCTVVDNQFIGGHDGLYAFGAGVSDLTVSGNLFSNQGTAAVNLDASTTSSILEDNTISSDLAHARSDYVAVVVGGGSVLSGNTIKLAIGWAGIVCVPDPSGVGCAIVGNVIKTPISVASVRIYANSTNQTVVNNYIQRPIANSGGASNTIIPNYTIP